MSELEVAVGQVTLIIVPANISMLNDVFAWFIVPLNAVGRF
jgi:hypothetical protein